MKSPHSAVLTKQQLVYRQLRKAILEGTVQPGERIIIDAVAQDLGMSPIPVREAISQLAHEGLLTIRPHAGAVVSEVPKHAIEEIFALMEALELAACRLALPKFKTADFDALHGLCTQMESATDQETWATLNRRFHEAVPRLAGLARVEELLVRVGEDWERLRRFSYGDHAVEERATANREHRDFVELLKLGRLPAIDKWIRDHNRNALKGYLKLR